jgi:hypothetical protein
MSMMSGMKMGSTSRINRQNAKNANAMVEQLRIEQLGHFKTDLVAIHDVCASESLAAFAKSMAINALKYFPNASKHFTARFDSISGPDPVPRVIAVLDDMTAFMMTSFLINETMNEVVDAGIATMPELEIIKEMTRKLKELFSLDAIPQIQAAVMSAARQVGVLKDRVLRSVESTAATQQREAAQKAVDETNARAEKFGKLFTRYYAAACTVDMQDLLLDLDDLLVEVGYRTVAPITPMKGGDLTAAQDITAVFNIRSGHPERIPLHFCNSSF